MSPVEWFYAQGDKQQGPVTATEIKALADAGKLKPDDLVWREGMDEWIAARRVKGLFESEAPAAAAPAAPPIGPPGTVPSPARPAPEAAPPVFEKSPAAFQRAREGPARHLFDFVLEFARGQFTGQFVRSTAKIFTAAGHYGLYAAMLVALVLAVTFGVKVNNLDPVLLGAGAVVMLYVSQYAAGRFCTALERLNGASPAQITSTALLDCVALLAMALGVVALVASAVAAVRTEQFLLVLGGLTAFILFEYAGFVSLNPDAMKISVVPDIRAGEEAIGLITFFLKLGLWTAPVAFGVGVVSGTIELLYCGYFVLKRETAEQAYAAAHATTLSILFFAALPLVMYVAFLVYYLAVDALRAVLSLPGKLDRLAVPDEESKEG